MKLIDLSQTISEIIPVYPGDPVLEIMQIADFANDGFIDHKISMGMHAGTHLDAPQHFVQGGKNISELNIAKFFGKGILIDARGAGIVDSGILNGFALTSENIVLVWTGWSEKFAQPEYYTDHPVLTESFARRLIESKIKMVGIDSPSPDVAPFPVHKLLLSREILIMENLVNLDQLFGREFEVVGLPAKFTTNAAPLRVVAKVL